MTFGVETARPSDVSICRHQLILCCEPLHQSPSSMLPLSEAWVVGQAGPTIARVHTAWPIITKSRACAKLLMQQCTALKFWRHGKLQWTLQLLALH